jgi:hypothetical protein
MPLLHCALPNDGVPHHARGALRRIVKGPVAAPKTAPVDESQTRRAW